MTIMETTENTQPIDETTTPPVSISPEDYLRAIIQAASKAGDWSSAIDGLKFLIELEEKRKFY